ncbi:radical SAM protein [candidate division WOR-3 bacterium]|nr:radical SAM protein [candidate division WOR-3 bacterium]
MEYQRFLTPEFTPFDPIELAEKTEKIITKEGQEGLERKYVSFYSAPVYSGIATGYAVGCCLRCIYCWTNWSRDFPEEYGKFYSPKEAADRLINEAEKGITSRGWEHYRHLEVNKLRVSGCEPTLGKEHLLKVLEHLSNYSYQFYLETNGILFGKDYDYVKRLAKYSDFIYVRVSFKAASPEGFTERTGAIGEHYELPFKALKNLLDVGIHTRAAAMTDPKIMPGEERNILIKRLDDIDPSARYSDTLEEEVIGPYDTTRKRLIAYTNREFARELEEDFKSR